MNVAPHLGMNARRARLRSKRRTCAHDMTYSYVPDDDPAMSRELAAECQRMGIDPATVRYIPTLRRRARNIQLRQSLRPSAYE